MRNTQGEIVDTRIKRIQYSLDQTFDAIVWIGPDARFVDVNQGACQALGYSREELLQMGVFDVDPEFPRHQWPLHWEALRRDKSVVVNTAHRRKDGTTYPVEVRTNFVEFDGQTFNCAVARDTSQRMKDQAALAASERRLREFLDLTDNMVTQVDAFGNFLYVNAATSRLMGVPVEALVGTPAFDCIHPDDKVATQLSFQKWVGLKVDTASFENRNVSSDGRVYDLLWTINPLYDGAGNLHSVWSMAVDITARKRVDEQIKASRDELDRLVTERTQEVQRANAYNRNLIDASIDPFLTITPDGKIADVNLATVSAMARTREELIGSSFAQYFTQPEKATEGVAAVLAQGRVRDLELSLLGPSGTSVPVELNATVFRDSDGSVQGVFAMARDITARKQAEKEIRLQHWLKAGLAELASVLRGDKTLEKLSSAAIVCLTEYCQADFGALYVMDAREGLRLQAGFAHGSDLVNQPGPCFALGQGLVGQAASSGKTIRLSDIPPGTVQLTSGLLTLVPTELVYVPLFSDGEVRGVVEMGRIRPFEPRSVELLESIAESLAVNIQSCLLRERQKQLLEQSQQMTEELRAQEEELKTANEELEDQTSRLRVSEEALRTQQEEMVVASEELREKNQLLERQKREVEEARAQAQKNSEALTVASRYKSEFLANMSHELRTPLNSVLLLARSLSENREGNLTPDQVESASVIYGSGSDLLNLINDVLDLAKVEAGRLELHLGKVPVAEMATRLQRTFRPLAAEKKLEFDVVVAPDAPVELVSDRARLEQVIRNLVSNAIKFTQLGSVLVTFKLAPSTLGLTRVALGSAPAMAVEVRDTGIGIAQDNHASVFDAFRQADGGTSRRFGGTGLGLSISRELASLLGGEILLESGLGKGSVFTLVIPVTLQASDVAPKADLAGTAPHAADPVRLPLTSRNAPNEPQWTLPDDRENLQDSDTVILIVEDDPVFAKIIMDTCHARGFKCLTSCSGDVGLKTAQQFRPNGVVLDLRLPGMDGLSVLSALKEDTQTRHIPVHVISAAEATTESLRKGAVGHATKPINRAQLDQVLAKLEQTASQKVKHVLLVEDDPAMRENVRKLVGNGQVKLEEASSGAEALQKLRDNCYSCIVLDLGLPDMDGAELLSRAQSEGLELPPVIVHTSRNLTQKEEMDLSEKAQSIVIKDVRSQERLLDEVTLFLHRMVSSLPEKKMQIIRSLHETDLLLKGKRILVVDDDMRTTFAVSRLLTERGMVPIKAANGVQALQLVQSEELVDLVLMDIMMPLMDGYEAMRQIRGLPQFRHLPIIALTAKAMPEDKQKCIEAGANDYLPKPLDPDRLISLLRVWLYR